MPLHRDVLLAVQLCWDHGQKWALSCPIAQSGLSQASEVAAQRWSLTCTAPVEYGEDCCFPPVFLLASSSPVKLSFDRNLWGDSVTFCRKWWVTVRSRWFANTWSCQFPAMDRTDCTSWGADLSPNLTAADPGLLNVRSHGQPLQTKQRRAGICANLCRVFDTTVRADLAIRIEPFMGAFSKSPSFSISQSVLFSVWLVQQQMWVIW